MHFKWKDIGTFIILLICEFILAYTPLVILLNTLQGFDLFIGYDIYSSSFLLSIFTVLILRIIGQIRKKLFRRSRLENFISTNTGTFILAYILIVLFIQSIKPEVMYDYEHAKDIITISWGIFAISITIFMVWNVCIMQFLREKVPQKEKDMLPFHFYTYISKKKQFHQRASVIFNSTSFLLINLMALSMATPLIYIVSNKVTLLGQNIVNASFYLSINTLGKLFIDILEPITEQKRDILDSSKVTTEELEFQSTLNSRITTALKIVEDIEKLTDIDKEKRAQLQCKVLKEACILIAADTIKSKAEVTHDDQL